MLKKTYLAILFLLLAGCASQPQQDGAPQRFVDVSKIHSPTPHPLPKSRYGNPSSYVVNGQRYYVLKNPENYVKRGMASWYGTKFDGQLTSSREPYDLFALTAASRDLPIPIYAKVTNLENGRSVIVKVNDRGPFVKNRVIDLSYAAAAKLGYAKKGTAYVKVEAITFAQSDKNTQRHYLQAGSFQNKENALALKSQIKHWTKTPVTIRKSNGLYRVQVGPLADDSYSARLENLLRSQGIDTINAFG